MLVELRKDCFYADSSGSLRKTRKDEWVVSVVDNETTVFGQLVCGDVLLGKSWRFGREVCQIARTQLSEGVSRREVEQALVSFLKEMRTTPKKDRV